MVCASSRRMWQGETSSRERANRSEVRNSLAEKWQNCTTWESPSSTIAIRTRHQSQWCKASLTATREWPSLSVSHSLPLHSLASTFLLPPPRRLIHHHCLPPTNNTDTTAFTLPSRTYLTIILSLIRSFHINSKPPASVERTRKSIYAPENQSTDQYGQ